MAPAVPIEFTGHRESRKCSFPQRMGKTQKFSKGHQSSGFIPNYRHAVETMGESEGFGSCGRMDTEMIASEDSYAPKRKCISLKVDGYDTFGVPLQVVPLSKMSLSEKKNLELQFRAELELVQNLQKRIASLSSNALSSASDIRSYSDGKNRPPLESLRKSSDAYAGRGKKRGPPGRSGSVMKRGSSGSFEPPKQAAILNTSYTMVFKQCETLLNRLMSHQYAWVFNTPVDVVKLNLPDYFTVIKHPMDLGTVKSKLVSGQYSTPIDFAADVRLTFSNAMTYNPAGNDAHIMAATLSKYFEVRWKPIEKKLALVTLIEPVQSRPAVNLETESAPPPLKKKKITSLDQKSRPGPVKRVMTEAEKHTLSMELEALLGELPENIVEFLKKNSFTENQTSEDEIEIDIDALSHETLFTLRKLLDDYLMEKQKKQEKVQPSVVELPNESGYIHSSMQPGKGNDLVDEDVDIGGNDPPMLSFPPVEIEKDTVIRNSKCSSSSSPSSGSGSSSSDSDSGTSSGSESDGPKTSIPERISKEASCPVVKVNEKSDLLNTSTENQSLDELGQSEPTSQSKPVSAKGDDPQDGESAPSERQVSPEKLYRAALLRNRFADTILKAREKTLEKSEKLDPEKLRLEKEELERQQKEEKARLQAEARAAEEARRKAEAEAAVRARKKRELEREAARLALQQMEKTVEINENSQFMEDLEMLRAAAPADQLLSLVNEMSPERSLDALGSFKFEGNSNPLEQLGLYMKADEEEEEEEKGKEGKEDDEGGKLHEEPEEGNGEAEQFQDDLGGFKFEGTNNPLETLGLYMKADDESGEEEEEEEIEKGNNEGSKLHEKSEQQNDVEDGEAVRSLDDLDRFKFEGSSNPLEQHGLYMKTDEGEEEEKQEEEKVEGCNPHNKPAQEINVEGVRSGCSPGIGGIFKSEGISNPLEQIGLYKKAHEEEDNEEKQSETKEEHESSGELHEKLERRNDVEDGEID